MSYPLRAVTPLPDRLFAKIDAAGPCWLWTGALNIGGYGAVRLGRRRPVRPVHRVVWELLVGPVPDGLDLDHLCRVRHCCNPDHLEPVTRQTNVDRGAHRAGNPQRTHCRHGHPITYGVPCRPCAVRRNREFRARQKATA